METFQINTEIDYNIQNISDAKECSYNPFLENVVYNGKTTVKRYKKGELIGVETVPLQEAKALTEQNKDLIKKDIEMVKRKIIQVDPFVLIYTNPTLNYKKMSETGFKLFFLILDKRININNDQILLSVQYCVEELELSRQTIAKGLAELVRNKLIYPREGNNYWINPNYFYSGNRLKINTK